MIDPRIFNAGAGAYYQPEMVALEQELLNAGLTVESADAAMNQAMVILTDLPQPPPMTADVLAGYLGVPPPPPDLIEAARQAIAALQGGGDMADPKVDQVLAQNALIADALYDLVKALAAQAEIDPALLQDAKTKVNALNPGKFTF